MPDIDSLPPPYSSHVDGSVNRHSPSPRASSASLAAAATINAGFQNEDSRRSSTWAPGNPTYPFGYSERRRSSAFLHSHDPSLPGPGELQTGDLRLQSGELPISRLSLGNRTSSPQSIGSPTYPPRYRDRTPSLGEIHQQLEQEQEAQVLRLLAMIRQGQAELQAIRDSAAPGSHLHNSDIGELTPSAERAASYPYVSRDQPSNPAPGPPTHRPSSPIIRSSFELSRPSSRRSRTPSRTASPSIRNASASTFAQGDEIFSSARSQSLMDENAYYQAETQTLTRENQMLRQRIRELERQLNDGNSHTTNSPVIPSNLSGPPIEAEKTDEVLGSETEEKKD